MSLDQLRLSPDNHQYLFGCIQDAILKSFQSDALRGDYQGKGHGMTNAEIKRRFKICETHAVLLRFNEGWSSQRIGDTMARLLRAVLDGDNVDNITKSSIWTPN